SAMILPPLYAKNHPCGYCLASLSLSRQYAAWFRCRSLAEELRFIYFLPLCPSITTCNQSLKIYGNCSSRKKPMRRNHDGNALQKTLDIRTKKRILASRPQSALPIKIHQSKIENLKPPSRASSPPPRAAPASRRLRSAASYS